MMSSDYEIKYYIDSRGKIPVRDYVNGLQVKEQAKVYKYIRFLKENEGFLDEPYSRHIQGKIRELRVDFARNRHRIFYFTFVGKKIVFLHAFLKKSDKTPVKEIDRAYKNYMNVLNNPKLYE